MLDAGGINEGLNERKLRDLFVFSLHKGVPKEEVEYHLRGNKTSNNKKREEEKGSIEERTDHRNRGGGILILLRNAPRSAFAKSRQAGKTSKTRGQEEKMEAKEKDKSERKGKKFLLSSAYPHPCQNLLSSAKHKRKGEWVGKKGRSQRTCNKIWAKANLRSREETHANFRKYSPQRTPESGPLRKDEEN